VVTTLQLYTVGIANYGGKHVMVCGHCGEAFVTDEVTSVEDPSVDQAGTLWGEAKKQAVKARQAAEAAGIPQSLQRARERVERGTQRLTQDPRVTSSTQTAREAAARMGDEVRRGVDQAGTDIGNKVDGAVDLTRKTWRGLFKK